MKKQVTNAIIDRVKRFVNDISALTPGLKEEFEVIKVPRRGELGISFVLRDSGGGTVFFGTKDTQLAIEDALEKIEMTLGSPSEFGNVHLNRPSEVVEGIKSRDECIKYGKEYNLKRKPAPPVPFWWTKWNSGAKYVCRRKLGYKPATLLTSWMRALEEHMDETGKRLLFFDTLFFTDWNGNIKQYKTAGELYEVITSHEEELARKRGERKAVKRGVEDIEAEITKLQAQEAELPPVSKKYPAKKRNADIKAIRDKIEELRAQIED